MKTAHPIKSGVNYIVGLVHAGVDGATAAERAPARFADLIRSVLAGSAAGVAVGAGSTILASRRSSYNVVTKSLIGGAVGSGCGLAWALRGLTRPMARGAIRNINLVREARWLEKNPIDYA